MLSLPIFFQIPFARNGKEEKWYVSTCCFSAPSAFQMLKWKQNKTKPILAM